MMASRRPTDGPRKLQRGKKKGSPMMQYLLIGGVLAVLLIVVVVLATGKKPAPPSKTKRTVSSEDGGVSKPRPPRTVGVAAKTARTAKSAKDQRREERRRQRELARAAKMSNDAARTKRSATGGYARSSSGSPLQLRAIIVDEAGTRYALVGDRRFKPGDDISGHKILAVGSDAVSVGTGANTYSVRVGQPIY